MWLLLIKYSCFKTLSRTSGTTLREKSIPDARGKHSNGSIKNDVSCTLLVMRLSQNQQEQQEDRVVRTAEMLHSRKQVLRITLIHTSTLI